MYVTEEEAREKFCQECFNNPGVGGACCIGSECMAWQWADNEYETYIVGFNFGLPSKLWVSREDLKRLLEKGYEVDRVRKPSKITENGKFVRYAGTLYVHLSRKNENRRGYCGKAMITVEVENC